MIRILLVLVLHVVCFFESLDAFVLRTPASMISSSSSAIFYQNEQADTAVAQTTPQATKKQQQQQQQQQQKVVIQIKKKPTIYPITCLEELHDFLREDDDRMTAIKFYAPWCKTCQRLGMRYQKLAMQWGDGVDRVARKAMAGEIRCAEVEFGSVTSRFVHDQLQIKAIPTLQLYKGTTKLWAGRGGDSIKLLEKEVKRLVTLQSQNELDEYIAKEVQDDGILEEAIEDSFFDNAYIE